jgi:hypothetical protein
LHGTLATTAAAFVLAAIMIRHPPLTNAQRDRTSGTAAGLTIVRRLCRLLDTEITLRSTPGRGSAFGFVLPPGPEERTTRGARVGPASAGDHGPSAGGGTGDRWSPGQAVLAHPYQ